MADELDIFISYARADAARAALVRDKLLAHNFTIFFDIDNVDSGEHFPAVIDREIRRAKCVLGLWSHAAFKGRWPPIECRFGLERGNLVAAFIDGMTPQDPNFPVTFHDVNAENLSDFDGDEAHAGWVRTLRAIRKHTAGVASLPPPSAPIARAAAPQRRTALIAAAAAAAALAIGVFGIQRPSAPPTAVVQRVVIDPAAEPSISIATPRPGAHVTRWESASGTASIKNARVWVIVQPEGLRECWVQEPAIVSGDHWQARVAFGEADSAGVRFAMMALLNPAEPLEVGATTSCAPPAAASNRIEGLVRD